LIYINAPMHQLANGKWEVCRDGKKRIEKFVNTQKELVEKLQEMNRQWFDRAQAEANLASELGAKLTAARSIPYAMAAYQVSQLAV
jgi:hypothetical protein